ncbi:MAG: hypothetical protein ACU0AX_12655 [Roseovarius sp.]|uniref:hypothetical protein n=1 Tax=Roseovarius sp. TaxID=1486281 RepID=UPI004057FB0F
MTRNAKTVPRLHPVSAWLTSEGINWQRWETRIAKETGRAEFRFDERSKFRIIEATRLVSGSCAQRTKIEDAKKTVRLIVKRLKEMNLPDHHLLRPGSKVDPSDFLMSIGFGVVQETFEVAMVHTLDEAAQGKSVLERLSFYGALLRKNKCVIDAPRSEAMAAYLVKEEFERLGIPAEVTHTWEKPSDKEDNEYVSVFEDFVFCNVLPHLSSDKAERETLRRRLLEAKRHLKLGN